MTVIRTSLAFSFIVMVLALSVTIVQQQVSAASFEFELHTADSAFVENGRTYAPVRMIGERLGAEVVWNPDTNDVNIRSNDEHVISISLDSREIKLNDVVFWSEAEPLMRGDRLHLPVRLIAELLHMRVHWDVESQTVKIYPLERYEVQKGDTVEAIAKRLGIDANNLRKYNGIENGALYEGEKLTIVFSQMLKENEWTDEEVQLLAKIIHAEAGYESQKGQIAVGNVIMNRVQSDSFPDTIQDVIYQPGQFTPAMNGKLESIQPNESSYEAAVKVLQGEQVADEALYFYNPKVTKSVFFTSRTLDAEIGNHRFVE